MYVRETVHIQEEGRRDKHSQENLEEEGEEEEERDEDVRGLEATEAASRSEEEGGEEEERREETGPPLVLPRPRDLEEREEIVDCR